MEYLIVVTDSFTDRLLNIKLFSPKTENKLLKKYVDAFHILKKLIGKKLLNLLSEYLFPSSTSTFTIWFFYVFTKCEKHK